jgi:predicted nucleic acid-binding protein
MRELLVDTSAWIEWLRATGSVADQLITAAFAEGYELTIAGVILQEVLQGCRNERHAADVTRLLASCSFAEPVYPETYEHAAALYRRCRRAGRSVRGTVDCLVAAVAMERNLAVVASDRDFETLHAVCGLRLAKPSG